MAVGVNLNGTNKYMGGIYPLLSTRPISSMHHPAPSSSFSSNSKPRPFVSNNQTYDGNRSNSIKRSLTTYAGEIAAKKLVKEYANYPQTSVNLQTLLRTGRGEFLHKTYKEAELKKDFESGTVATERVLMQVAGFLRRELPIRFAHRIKDLDNVPLMKDMPSVQQVKRLYLQSFLDLLKTEKEVKTVEDEAVFAKIIEEIYERHSSVLVTMARGAFELRKAVREGKITSEDGGDQPIPIADYDLMEDLHEFLDRFYVSRIGIRVLIGQYLSLRQPPVENYIGIICNRTSPYEVVQQAVDDATFMCTRRYGDAPEVIISG